MKKFLGNVIKQRRNEIGLSQEELAKRIYINAKTIRRIEKGEGNRESINDVLKELNLIVEEPNVEAILSESRSVNLPNVNTGRDLAHLLVKCEYIDYIVEPTDEEFIDESVVEDFMDKIQEMMEVFDDVEQQDRQVFINIFDQELKSLNNQGIYIYGSCNDTLVNTFKYTKLVFKKAIL